MKYHDFIKIVPFFVAFETSNIMPIHEKSILFPNSSEISQLCNRLSVCITLELEKNNFEEIKNKIANYGNLAVSENLPELPNQSSIEAALRIYKIFEGYCFSPQKVSPSVEGGVLFEFFKNGTYYAIEIHNSGEIIQVIRNKGEKGIISELSENDLISTLQSEFSTGAEC